VLVTCHVGKWHDHRMGAQGTPSGSAVDSAARLQAVHQRACGRNPTRASNLASVVLTASPYRWNIRGPQASLLVTDIDPVRRSFGMIGRRWSAMLAVSAASLGVACVVLLAGAGSALACVTDGDGDCWHPNYHIQRTDGSLAAWTGPGLGQIAYWLGGNGTPVEVVCETTGAREDGQPYVVWDQLDDGTYVYGYYLDTPGDGYHPALPACPGSPGKVPAPPTSVTAVPISSTAVHVSWRDNTSNSASYVVVTNSGRSSRELAPGTTGFDWTVNPGSYTCFSVVAKGPGGQSASWPYACATTPASPWCPTNDPTAPTCSQLGAFQAERGYDHSGRWTIGRNDYKHATPQGAQVVVHPIGILTPGPGGNFGGNLVGTAPDTFRWNEALAFAAGFHVATLTDAEDFFQHYLSNTGTDLTFDARVPYLEAPGFAVTVNATVKKWVTLVNRAADTFDSGYLVFDPPGSWTNDWRNIISDWQNAIRPLLLPGRRHAACRRQLVGASDADQLLPVHPGHSGKGSASNRFGHASPRGNRLGAKLP
jgi:hypothetical protein